MGAWIETLKQLVRLAPMPSHPMWVRGLKHIYAGRTLSHPGSHPMWVRGLKHTAYGSDGWCTWSHPMWVRGLKHI